MRRFITLLFLIALVSNIFAQRQAEAVELYNPISFSKADTLMPGNFANGTPTLYAATNGFVAGVNGYGDLAKAQAFDLENFTMSSVGFWFGAKEITDEADTVVLTVYNMDGTGTAAAGEVSAPGTVVATKAFTTNDIDTTGNLTVVELDEALELSGNYAIGFDLTKIVNDTIGLISTTDGDATEELSWEQWSGGGDWYTFAATSSWELAVDLAIFPIGTIAPSYNVTFNVDMRPAITEGNFVIGEDTVSLTGTITGWTEPIAGPEYIFADDDQDSIYTAVIQVAAGDHEYKYFKNSTWSNGEWDGGDNRAITVDAEMTVNDVWGEEPVSILDAPASIDVNVYPNPSNGIIRVEAEGTNQVSVISAIGQVIISKQIENKGTINLTNNASGVYFVRVENGNKTGVRRVVIE